MTAQQIVNVEKAREIGIKPLQFILLRSSHIPGSHSGSHIEVAVNCRYQREHVNIDTLSAISETDKLLYSVLKM